MRSSVLKKAVTASIRADLAAFIWGPPGVGKSDMVREIGNDMDMNLIDLRLSQMDPVDIRGIPSVDRETKTTSWNPPDFLPTVERHGPNGILFFDELNSAHQASQTVAYQIILDRKVGDYELPPGWIPIAAGNRMEDKAIVNRMSSALSTRFQHFDFDVYWEDWVQWANQNNIHPEVISFIRWKNAALHKMNTEERSFPCPRTWAFVSKFLPHASPEFEYEGIAGIVGPGAAGEFITYTKIYRDLPDPDKIIADPQHGSITNEPSVMFAICGSLSHRATETNFDKIVEFAERIPHEYQTIMLRDSMARIPELRHHKSFKAWTRKNAKDLL